MTAPAILVIKLGALGDVIQALGPIAAIRRHHPEARIVWLTAPPFADLARACPDVDEVWIDPRPRPWQIGAWLDLRRRLRAARFVRVYDLQTSDRSGFYFRLLGPGAKPEWSGIAAGCSHPHCNPNRDRMHTIERQAEQLRLAGIASVPSPDLAWLTADLSRFAAPASSVILAPGGAAHRPAKRWPVERYGELARRLWSDGLTPVLIGGAEETAPVARLCPGALDLGGQTSLAELAQLARGARAAVGNDTGPMHLIAAVGCPSVVLYASESDPDLCGQRGAWVRFVRRPTLESLEVGEVLALVPPSLAANRAN